MRLGDTPVPIPNTMVKTQTADGTILETVWESRRLPGPFLKRTGGQAQGEGPHRDEAERNRDGMAGVKTGRLAL